MKNSKLMIVGLDGLDHGLAVKWGIRGLLQKSHGTFNVKEIGILYTPLIWSSILCGLNVTEAGYNYENAVRKSMGITSSLRRFKKIPGGKTIGSLVKKALVGIGILKANFRMPDHLIEKTFLEVAKRNGLRVFSLEVPGYDEVNNGRLRIRMHDIAPKLNLNLSSKFIDEVKKEVIRRVNITKRSLGDYDVIMTYMPLPDLAHHLYCGRKLLARVKTYAIYKWLEKIVLNELIIPASMLNYTILILSDHGFNIGECTHSDEAFWSLSRDMSFNIKGYKDIKPLILKLLGLQA